uniref:Uncharacterized protein n=1 Tax=Arundo donax TaxID=35708 RepID=A0A0A9EAP3_ARUDO
MVNTNNLIIFNFLYLCQDSA